MLFMVNACCNLAHYAFSQSGSDSCICDVALHEIKHVFPLVVGFECCMSSERPACCLTGGGAGDGALGRRVGAGQQGHRGHDLAQGRRRRVQGGHTATALSSGALAAR